CQNEDDIFWFTTEQMLEKCPTYHQQVRQEFSDWLSAKYHSQQALAEAWGGRLQGDESLEARNIEVQGNPWFRGNDGMTKRADEKARMLDNAAFFHSLQDQFYGKFVAAVRGAGYKGPLVGSP